MGFGYGRGYAAYAPRDERPEDLEAYAAELERELSDIKRRIGELKR